VRADFEGFGIFGPGLADRLEGGSPLQRLEVLGEVVGGHEGKHVRGEAREGLVMKDLHGGLFDRAGCNASLFCSSMDHEPIEPR
jgi:hypothetical protein